MNTTKKILEVTKLTYINYDNFREACYLRWCQQHAVSFALSIKEMVRHDGLRNWYCDQWIAMVEKQFIKDNADFLDIEAPLELQGLLVDYPQAIMNHYPKPLIKMMQDELRKNRIKVQ